MEWTATTSLLVVLILLPLATAAAVMGLLLAGRMILRGGSWRQLSGWCETCATGCQPCCPLGE